MGRTGAYSERPICLVNPKFRATELAPQMPVSVIPLLNFSAANSEIAFERNIPSDFSDRDRRDLYIRGRLVAAPPIAPCGQVQRRKRKNGQQK